MFIVLLQLILINVVSILKINKKTLYTYGWKFKSLYKLFKMKNERMNLNVPKE